MKHRLIDEFCGAIEEWGRVCDREPGELAEQAMLSLGAPWFVRPEGAVEDPDSPEHRGKTVREVRGQYTMEQVHDYLATLVNNIKLMEDILIKGLADAIERHLQGLVDMCREDGAKRSIEAARSAQEMYEHPENYPPEFFEELKKRLAPRFGPDIDLEKILLESANFTWKMATEMHPEDELPQLEARLAAWVKVSAPVIARENLDRWRNEFFRYMTKLYIEQNKA